MTYFDAVLRPNSSSQNDVRDWTEESAEESAQDATLTHFLSDLTDYDTVAPERQDAEAAVVEATTHCLFPFRHL